MRLCTAASDSAARPVVPLAAAAARCWEHLRSAVRCVVRCALAGMDIVARRAMWDAINTALYGWRTAPSPHATHGGRSMRDACDSQHADAGAGADAGPPAVVLTTHFMEEAQVLCDHAAYLHAGRVLWQGVPREGLEAVMGGQALAEEL